MVGTSGGSSKVAEIHSLNLHSLGGEHSWGDLEWLCGGQAWEAQPGPREAHEKGRPHRARGTAAELDLFPRRDVGGHSSGV